MGKFLRALPGNFWSDGLSLPEWVAVMMILFDTILLVAVLINITMGICNEDLYSPYLFELFKHVSTTQIAPVIIGVSGYSAVKYYADAQTDMNGRNNNNGRSTI